LKQAVEIGYEGGILARKSRGSGIWFGFAGQEIDLEQGTATFHKNRTPYFFAEKGTFFIGVCEVKVALRLILL
jgi:hypothetical protein